MNLIEQSLIPLIGGIAVLASIAGLGFLARRALGSQDVCPIPEAAAVGVGCLILVGGFLNLVGAVTLPVVLGVEGLGLIGLVLNGRVLARRLGAWARDPAALIVCGVLALVYLRSVTNAWFALSDDLNGYLEPVARLAQTGTLGRDPFLLERLTGGPGAYFFLEAVFVMQFGYYQIALLQPALGILIAVGAAVSYLRSDRIPTVPILAAAIAICASFARVDYLATAAVLQAGLLAALIIKLLSGKQRSLADAVTIGLILGGAVSLKVLAIPFAGVLALAWLASDALTDRNEVGQLARVAAIAGLTALITLAPWMASSYASSGTLLFPLLGVGYYASAYGTVAFPYDGAIAPYVIEFFLHYKRILLGIALLVAAVVGVYSLLPRRTAADHFMAAIALAALPLVLLIAVLMEATDFLRYAHSTYGSVTVAGLAWATRRLRGSELWRSLQRALAGAAALVAIGVLQSPHPHAFAVRSFANLAQLVTADPSQALRIEDAYARNPPAHAIPLFDGDEQAALGRAQGSTKAGTTILVSLQRPYLLDFRRNEIWSAGNYGGSTSPPPGFPIDGTGEQIAVYLRAVGMDYVLLQYAGPEAWFDHEIHVVATGEFEDNPWNDSAVRVSVNFRDALKRLMVGAGVGFRDDRFVVIRLGTP